MSTTTERLPAPIPARPAGANLRRTVQTCRACDLWEGATQAVMGEGSGHARVILVGEQPCDKEDLRGHPFVGPAGRVLNRALERAGLATDEAYLTNVVKQVRYKPRGKRRIHQRPDRWQAAHPSSILGAREAAARSLPRGAGARPAYHPGMPEAGAIVLAGGRSSRMGSDKASLAWHGSTLLRRVTGILTRAVDGPVIVVRAALQSLPALDPAVEVVADERPERGPLEGLAAGLHALAPRADWAYVCATDAPLLHPAFVHRLLDERGAGDDIIVSAVRGRTHPLAAVYAVTVLDSVEALLAQDHTRLHELLAHCRVRVLSEAELLADSELARLDPQLRSVENLNDPDDYARALALPPPLVEVDGRSVRAYALGAAGAREPVVLNGEPVRADLELPLVAGDALSVAPR